MSLMSWRRSIPFLVPAPTEQLAPDWFTTPLHVEHQIQSLWCWAAVTASIGTARSGTTLSQCTVVHKTLSRGDCCSGDDPIAKGCNKAMKLGDPLSRFGLLRKRSEGRLSIEDLRVELAASIPVAIWVEWRGGGGHFVVVVAVASGDERLRISDPLDPSIIEIGLGRVARGGYKGRGTWTHTYLIN
jgi:Papain-like cysteine protease AvrRpt2